jgi:predicted anti-sigma-YlaC factor YlaD
MLSCKQVASLASDHLDKNTHGVLNWKIRMHLMMCSHCRRFFRQLKITNAVTRTVLSEASETSKENVDELLQRIKESAKEKK